MASDSAFEYLKLQARTTAERPTNDALQLLAIQGERKWESKFKHRFRSRRDHMAVRTDLETRSVDGATTVRVREHTDHTPGKESVLSILGRCIDGFTVKAQQQTPCRDCGLTVSCICSQPMRRDQSELLAERREPSTPCPKPSVTTDDFIRDMRRAAGLKVEVE